MPYVAISVEVSDSILRQSAMARNDYPNPSFPLDVPLHALCQPARTCRDPGGKPSGTRVYCPSLRFSQSTLDDSGRNQGRPLPMFWAVCLQLAPTQGCQELSRTECEMHVAAATRSLQ